MSDLGTGSALEDCRPVYWLPRDNLAGEVLIPGFYEASAVACMVGYFSSSVLADLAPGLATYIAKAGSNLRLVISPFLQEADQIAMEAGMRTPEQLAADFLTKGIVEVDDLRRHTLRCLSYLLANGRIVIRVALMRSALFHPKVWLFETARGVLAAHGSSNMTRPGIAANKEQVIVSKSWIDPTQAYIVSNFKAEFERLWKNVDNDCVVIPLPEAVRGKLLKDYPADRPPTESEFRELYDRARHIQDAPSDFGESPIVLPAPPNFTIPAWLRYEDGPYAHQGRAVAAWADAGYRGTLEMATGSGKTITSMIGAYRLLQAHKKLLVIVAAPYVPLIQQWCGEIELFGPKPTNLTTVGNAADRARILQNMRRRLRLSLSNIEIAVVSHDTLCTAEFADAVAAFECSTLLVADEAHNLGRLSFIGNPPHFFAYRLALSATPVRQYDPDGTEAIFDFFGPVVFSFTLKEAIGICLVEYDYFVHPISLTILEMDGWNELTARIRKNAWRQSNGKPDDFLANLFRDRRLLLETASGKLNALSRLLEEEDPASLRHTLIYASDKAPEQLEAVNALLRRKGILFHQLTAEETADREKTARIIRAFQAGEIQVLTAKRVLDEGVNIPQITRAFILASTTVERQWIQRRGRLLRKCDEIGKTHSTIHDFLALPPLLTQSLDADAKALIKSELRRAQEFASLARNAGSPNGALHVIHPLVQMALM